MTFVLKPLNEKPCSTRIEAIVEGRDGVDYGKLWTDIFNLEQENLYLKENINNIEWLQSKLNELLVTKLGGVK